MMLSPSLESQECYLIPLFHLLCSSVKSLFLSFFLCAKGLFSRNFFIFFFKIDFFGHFFFLDHLLEQLGDANFTGQLYGHCAAVYH